MCGSSLSPHTGLLSLLLFIIVLSLLPCSSNMKKHECGFFLVLQRSRLFTSELVLVVSKRVFKPCTSIDIKSNNHWLAGPAREVSKISVKTGKIRPLPFEIESGNLRITGQGEPSCLLVQVSPSRKTGKLPQAALK